MNPFNHWKIIRKRLWLVLLLLVLFSLGAFLYIRQQESYYSTSVLLRINPAAPNTLSPGARDPSVGFLINTYSEYMRTRPFASLVAAELTVDLPEEAIPRMLSTQAVRDTQFFRITATHAVPAVAQELANTAAQVLIDTTTSETDLSSAQELERQRLLELKTLLEEELIHYTDRIEALEAEIVQLQQGPRTQEVELQISNLRSEQFSLRASRVEVLSSLSDVETTLNAMGDSMFAMGTETATILDSARLPTQPLPREMVRILFAALTGALALGVTLTWGLELLNNRVETPDELDAAYGAPVLGAIGKVPPKGNDSGKGYLSSLHQFHSPVAESFRSLRTAIYVAGMDRPIRSLLITSADPSEGKTFIATNLAVSLAQSGRRVILVDTDLRHPQIDRIFGLGLEPGFTNWFAQAEASPSAFLQHTQVDNLQVLTSGTIPANPAEILNAARAGEIMLQLEQLADLVLYDSPPAAVVTDALLLATRVDALIQVVRAKHTPIDLIRRCKALLQETNVHILGPVLNRAETTDLGYYAYHYHHTSYLNNEKYAQRSAAEGLKELAEQPNVQRLDEQIARSNGSKERFGLEEKAGKSS